jgi:DNA-binding FadR family transcriptional regulator
VLQTRLMVEPRIAALAVANATMADLRTLEAVIDEAAAAEARQRLEALDITFHEALATATHNELIAAIAREIATARGAVLLAPAETLAMPPEERAAVLEEFRTIVAAVRARDSTAAAQAVRRGLIRSTRAFSMLARMELLPDDED